jgi:hypothetical protein
MRRIALAAVLALPCAAHAQDRPPLAPTKDATIDYRIEGGTANGVRQMRMLFSAGGRMIRINLPGQPSYMVMDRNANRILIVLTDAHRYLERPMPPGQHAPFEVPRDQTFTRKGSETIAGLRCSVWETHGEHSGSGCVTDDGLVLRGTSEVANGGRMQLIATGVKVAPIEAEMFHPPQGFTRMELPAGRPGAPRP